MSGGYSRSRSKADLNHVIRYSSDAGKLSEVIEFTNKVKFAAPPKKKKKVKKLQFQDLLPKEVLSLNSGTSLDEIDRQRKASGFKASKVKPKKSSNASAKKNLTSDRQYAPTGTENAINNTDRSDHGEEECDGTIIDSNSSEGRENVLDNANKDTDTSTTKGSNLKPKTKTDKRVIVKEFLNQKKKVPLTVSQFSEEKNISTFTLKQWILAYTSGQLNEKKKEKKQKLKEKKNVKSKKLKSSGTPSSSGIDAFAKLTEETLAIVEKKKKLKRALTPDEQDAEDLRLYMETVKSSTKTRKMYDVNFLGNDDECASIDSAALDEDICYFCGASTKLDENEAIVLCDKCDGEYHLACMSLDGPPEGEWVCKGCVLDESEFKGLKFLVDGARPKDFALPKKKRKENISFCYSPSKPIDLAWEECQQKGFMCVSKVFSHYVMKKLTHGPIVRTTSSGRIADTWHGALKEISSRIKDHCRNLTNREGRYDLRIPDYVVDALGLNDILEPITSRLQSIMGTPTPIIRTHNIVFVPAGTEAQGWHADDSLKEVKLKKHRYFTVLIHLNPIDHKCGGTEIWSREQQVGDLVRGRPGDAFVFHGTLWHRGQANSGYHHRFFYYCSFSCRADANTDKE